jgi:hypothetical protein
MWAAETEAEVRTPVGAARFTSADVFEVVLSMPA